MIYLIIITLPIGFARALQSFDLPDYKPFSCQSCLSFWISVIASSIIDWQLMPLAFTTYLLSDLILIYESK